MEAMAAGCRVVTTDLAALPETTAGFAELIPPDPGFHVYREEFVKTVVNVLNQSLANSNGTVERLLRRQLAYAVNECSWDRRAREWDTWLRRLLPRRTMYPSIG